MRRTRLPLAVASLASACQSFQPATDPAVLRPDAEVRVDFASVRPLELVSRVDSSSRTMEVSSAEGRMLLATADSLRMKVVRVRNREGWVIQIPDSLIATVGLVRGDRIHARQKDDGLTTLAVVGGVGLGVSVVVGGLALLAIIALGQAF